tara:strand:- start:2231 stop:2506 length:276 start_codon:yes stop_codon:yes gene_type:complete
MSEQEKLVISSDWTKEERERLRAVLLNASQMEKTRIVIDAIDKVLFDGTISEESSTSMSCVLQDLETELRESGHETEAAVVRTTIKYGLGK